LKQRLWRSFKVVIVVFIVLSSGLASYIHWEAAGFDPIKEIQSLRNQGLRDDALEVVNFLKQRMLGKYPEIISNLKEELNYGFLEKVKSAAWNGALKGEVYDTYSGLGSISADLTLFGDLRDLLIQTWKKIWRDPDADNWVMGLSIAGISFSAVPFINGSYAVAKSLAKYSQTLPAMPHNPVLKQFLSGNLKPGDSEKIWHLFKETGGSVPATAASLSRITRPEDIDTVLSLTRNHKKTGNAFIILAGEKGVDLYRMTPGSLKGKFIEVFRRNPKAVMGLTQAHFVIHSIKVLHKHGIVALILPFMAAALFLGLFPAYVAWGVFAWSLGYLAHLIIRRASTKNRKEMETCLTKPF
jgi:hypothetical protein